MKRFIPMMLFLGLFAILSLGIYRVTEDPGFTKHIPSPLIGNPAPDFSLPELFNPEQKISASMMKGHVWMMNIWAEWCASCWAEHEYLVHLKEVEKVKIIGLDWKDEPPRAKSMINRMGNPFFAIANDISGDISIDWGVTGAPETFVIDKKGIVRWKHAGPLDPNLWREELGPLIKRLEKEI